MRQKFDIVERETIVNWAEQTLWDKDGKTGRDYLLLKRQIKEDTIRKFRLGFVPEWANHQLANRIIFPIFDASENLIAISSRLISDKKTDRLIYWHEQFTKSFYLYGINLAKQRIRKTKFAILTEGNFDVIKCHDCGLTNVVGLLGTSISDIQLSVLLRYSEDIIFVFDNDENRAGQKGKARVQKKDKEYKINIDSKNDYQQAGAKSLLNIGFVHLSEANDPDEYVRTYGILPFKKLIKQQLDIIRR